MNSDCQNELSIANQIRPKSWKASIIKCIIQEKCPVDWEELQRKTGFSTPVLNRALHELQKLNIIFKSPEVSGAYPKYQISEKYLGLFEEIYEPKRVLVRWIGQWKTLRNIDFSEENQHFFLERRHLDDFIKELIVHASFEVLAVNPFIQECDLSNTLREAQKKKGMAVKIITRRPEDMVGYLEQNKAYHAKLKQDGISLIYDQIAHAKIVIADRAVAVISSMNFYPKASAGGSWEAGIVTMDKNVVDSVILSFAREYEDASRIFESQPQ